MPRRKPSPAAPRRKRVKDLPVPKGSPDHKSVKGGRAPTVTTPTKVPVPSGPVPIPYPNVETG